MQDVSGEQRKCWPLSLCMQAAFVQNQNTPKNPQSLEMFRRMPYRSWGKSTSRMQNSLNEFLLLLLSVSEHLLSTFPLGQEF